MLAHQHMQLVSEILDNDLSGNAKEMGEYMKEQLAKLPHVKEARGRGLLVGCEYDMPIALEVKHGCLDAHGTDHSDRRQALTV